MPKVSVITINFNDQNGLEKTIQSVVSQTVSDLEFIVIDGGSTDNSVNVIKKYVDKITYWVSEKDKGIYDAQNKGIARATGDYLLFLNAGDCFYNASIIENFYKFGLLNAKKIIYGNTRFLNPNNTAYIIHPPQKLDLNFWYSNTINHQAVFFDGSLFKMYGNFNTEYTFASDFEFLFKIYRKEPAEFAYFNELICNYDNTGLTSKDEYHKFILKERKEIILKYTTKNEFSKMRKAYLNTLSLKRKYMTIIRENTFLRTTLKPFYKLYQYFTK
jgi:glycosyltransferase involved in cell wall biosynthesis